MTSRRTSIGEQFAPHTIAMLRSPAWRALSLSARRILDRIEIELADHGGTDNGKLPVTYDDFEQYGQILVAENALKTPKSIVQKPPLQAIVQNPPLLSISRGRSGRERSLSLL